jgi:hypothetical protein
VSDDERNVAREAREAAEQARLNRLPPGYTPTPVDRQGPHWRTRSRRTSVDAVAAGDLDQAAPRPWTEEADDRVYTAQLDAWTRERGFSDLERRIVHALILGEATRTALADALGISRPQLYRHRDRLARELEDFLG